MAEQDLSGQDISGRDSSRQYDTDALVGITEGTDTVQTDVISTGEAAAPAPARRRGPDPLALVVGLATLAMAVFAFIGELPDLSGFDPRWLLAGGAALVGLVLLVGSLRGRRGGG